MCFSVEKLVKKDTTPKSKQNKSIKHTLTNLLEHGQGVANLLAVRINDLVEHRHQGENSQRVEATQGRHGDLSTCQL